MNNKITNRVLAGIIIISFLTGLIFFPWLTDPVATHWNLAGEVDGYMGRFWGVFMLPLLMTVMFFIYLIIPKIDPLKQNIKSIRKPYNNLWLLILVFLFYLYGLVIFWNLGYRFNFLAAVNIALAALFYFTGGFIGKLKRNWFMGIRTPWTMTSDIVWDKTHKLGGKLFKVTSLTMLAGTFFPQFFGWLFFVPIFLTVFITFVYSYSEYRKLGKK